MSQFESGEIKPWYRQFWCWFVFAPLIFIVIVCSGFVYIAVNDADDVVVDNYYKQGRMINATFDQDKRAVALGLSANTVFDRESGEVILNLESSAQESAFPEKILLVMSHPAEQSKDQFIELTAQENRVYRGNLTTRPSNSWYILLYAVESYDDRDQAEWIIAGQINFDERASLTLNPRVQ